MYISNDSTNCHFIIKKKQVGTILKHILLQNVGDF